MSCINKNLILLKILLFTFYGALGCLMAFLTIHMRHIGLSMEEITWINSILPLTSLVGPPLVGMLADRLGHYRPITIVCMLLAAFLHTALLFVPSYEITSPQEPTLTFRCDSGGSAIVVDPCGHPCPEPLHYYASFKVWGCQHVCRGPPGENTEGDEGGGISLVNASSSQPPANMRLKTIGGTKDYILYSGDEFFLEINRTLAPSRWKGEGDSRMCHYPQHNFYIEDTEYVELTCQVTTSHCQVICNASEQVSGTPILQKPVCSIIKGNRELTLWLYFAVRAMAEMFSAILVSLLEAVALTMVHQHNGDYGREKMCGLLAVGLFSPLCGYLVDTQIGTFGMYSYAPVFYVFDGLMMVTAAVTLALPIQVQVQRKSLLKNISQLVRTTELSVLLFLMMILGTFWGYLKTFVYIYMEDLQASKLLMGLTVTFGIIPSLPFLYKSAAVVQYCGHHYLIMLAFLGYCFRFAGFSYISNPWWALLLESLELFTLNLMNVSAATLAYKLAPKSFVATAQALVWVSHFNIGRCIGTFVGGHLWTMYGAVPVFQGAAVVAAICAAIYLSIHQLIKYLKGRQNVQPKPQQSRENGNVPNGHYAPLQVADDRF